MNCFVCGGPAEDITPNYRPGKMLRCDTCGVYEISRPVIDSEIFQRLGAEERNAMLEKAKARILRPGAAVPILLGVDLP